MMRLKPLVCMMAMLPAIFLPATTTLHASDLSIYKSNVKGNANILLMLDTSGSMGISSLVLPKNNTYGSPGDVDTPLCERIPVNEGSNIWEWAYNLRGADGKTAIKKTVTIGGTAVDYYMRGCTKSGVTEYDRLSRLKDAIIQLLAKPEDEGGLPNETSIGLGHFSSKTPLLVGKSQNKLTDSHSGRILIPVGKLNNAKRLALAQKIAEFQSVDSTTDGKGDSNANLKFSSIKFPDILRPSSGTPTAQAYAEAAAAMMGTGTGYDATIFGLSSVRYIYDGYMVKQYKDEDGQAYFICASLGTGRVSNNLGDVKQCPSAWPAYDSTNKTITSGTLVYRPDASAATGWTKVTASQLKAEVGDMNSTWEIYSKLPEGWRLDGWMKVNHEPMDLETMGGIVYNYNNKKWTTGTKNISNLSECQSVGGDEWSSSKCYKVTTSTVSASNKSDCERKGGVWSNNTTKICTVTSRSQITTQVPSNTLVDEGSVIRGLVAYRTNPFALQETSDGHTNNTLGGYRYSELATKAADNKYIRGGTVSSCEGNGIYFLTDGAPNSSLPVMAKTVMNQALDNTTYHITQEEYDNATKLISPRLKSNLFDGETGSWEYIGLFAQKLADATKNPLGKSIKTAVVGFGSSFAGVPRSNDGVYNCESIPNKNNDLGRDTYNACKWGSDEYGKGGFYYAVNSSDISDSIIDFVDKVGASFEPSSMGTISIPRDPLDQTQMMGEGFFPIIVPTDAATVRTWIGNLKKYKIEDGTLKDASGNAIYTESATSQSINKSAKDLWSNAPTSDDHSSALSGGALNNIPVTSLMDSDGEFSKDSSQRNLFVVDFSGSVTDIKQIAKAVTKESLATDYSPDDGEPEALSENITAEQRYALLNYLGYKTAYPPANLAITSAILREYNKPNVPYRFLGGVVHSTPLMVTKSATLKADGTGTDKRDEYVVYGSFEGGLHIVDAGTGEEKSVFVPEEILRNQTETLANPDAESENGLAYGVDAPWALDSAYKVTTETIDDTTTTSYKATRLNIYGGLRMGGEALYGLNIENPSSPKLLFHITPSTSGFERMGQIWAKPTVTEILVKGKRKRVLIFGGGYDADVYEKPADVFVKPTAATKGNALYILEADTGNFIASVSSNSNNSSTVVDSANDQSDEVKYSVVGQPVVRDYNADGLADMIYFADLGGQIFRIDLNNNAQFLSSASADVIVRTKRIAHLATNTFTPRFYERLTTAVFNTDSGKLAVLVTAGSGNRSYPLEAENAPNSVYGILDYDAAMTGLEKSTYSGFQAEATAENLAERGKLGVTHTSIKWGEGGTGEDDKFRKAMTPNGTLRGWMLQLANTGTGNVAKSMEESQLIAGDLYVNVYDPNASLSATGSNQCGGGVKGLSTIHRICTPYADCAAYVNKSYQGIVGPTLGKVTGKDRASRLIGPIKPTSETCVGNCTPEGTSELPEYSQKRTIKPTRWFEW